MTTQQQSKRWTEESRKAQAEWCRRLLGNQWTPERRAAQAERMRALASKGLGGKASKGRTMPAEQREHLRAMWTPERRRAMSVQVMKARQEVAA